jgi:hypothetical protein
MTNLHKLTANTTFTSTRVGFGLLCAVAACGSVKDTPDPAPDAAPTCTDGVKNGTESDVDCGGSCEACVDGKFCSAGADCASTLCNNGTCVSPTCVDGMRNGDEIDIDCGGSCGAGSCKIGQTCTDNTQCVTQVCTSTSAGTKVCASPKHVFVTINHYTGGAIGSLTLADRKCQDEADAAHLSGVFKAWLSDSTGSPSTRFTRNIVPYMLVGNPVLIAQNWNDLTDGALAHAINRNALGNPQGGGPSACDPAQFSVYTNTQADGTMYQAAYSCSNWTSNTGPSVWGVLTAEAPLWTHECEGGDNGCAKASALLCFEQ